MKYRHTALSSMISNYDLTEMCEILNSMWTAQVLVTKTASVHQNIGVEGFFLVGIPYLS